MMDTDAARRARQAKIKRDLLDAFTDEEACPPEFVDLAVEVDDRIVALRELVAAETQRFVAEPDIRAALRRRDRIDAQAREQIRDINAKVRRLNLISPHDRFQRALLDAEAVLRPLYRVRRAPAH